MCLCVSVFVFDYIGCLHHRMFRGTGAEAPRGGEEGREGILHAKLYIITEATAHSERDAETADVAFTCSWAEFSALRGRRARLSD